MQTTSFFRSVKGAIVVIAGLMCGLSARGQWIETFDEYPAGQSVIATGNGRYKVIPFDPPLDEAQCRQFTSDPVNATHVLEHKSRKITVITRVVDGQFPAVSGTVVSFIDVKPIKGDHNIFCWQNEAEYARQGAAIHFDGQGKVWAAAGRRQPERLIGPARPDRWYRVKAVMHIDPADGNKSTYDVTVTDLAARRTVGSLRDLTCPGEPTAIGGAQIQSGASTDGLEARFDNWSILPDAVSRPDPAARRETKVLFFDGFLPDALDAWTVNKDYTAAEVTVADRGQLSPTSVEIRKPDCAGTLSFTKRIAVPAGHYLRLSLDLQSLQVRPIARYAIEVTPLNAQGRAVNAKKSFPFDDGITINSAFGGESKTPQTLGEWKTTRHVFKVEPNATQIETAIVFREGQQRVRIDNFLLEDLGVTEPAKAVNPPVYARQIRSAGVAMLTLDMLLPGYSYRVKAHTDSPDHSGMGITMRWRTLRGDLSDPVQLARTSEAGRDLEYRLEVPYRAVEVLLDLNNSDLAKYGYYQGAKYRNWRQIEIYPLGELSAPDVIFYHYQQGYGEDRDLIKPRELTELSAFDRQALIRHLEQRPWEDAAVRLVNDGMAFAVGKQLIPPFYSGSFYTGSMDGKLLDTYSDLASHGLPIVRITNVEGGPAMGGQWLGPGRYDFSRLDLLMYTALKKNPDSYISFEIKDLNAPLWWGDTHPDQIVQNPDGLSCAVAGMAANSKIWGKMANGELRKYALAGPGANPWYAKDGYKCPISYLPSPASRAFRADMKKFLTALRRHIEAQPYGKAVIGYYVDWGFDYQWNWPTQVSNQIVGKPGEAQPQLVDYSPAMAAYFRDSLRAKYRTVGALRAAWRDPGVTFETAAIPSPAARKPVPVKSALWPNQTSLLVDPATRRPMLDYLECYNGVIGDMASDMGEAIKAAAPRKVITVAYLSEDCRYLGHSRVLRGNGIDISGGACYEMREVGQPGVSPHLIDSYKLHGKMAFIEFDHRLFTQAYRAGSGVQLAETVRKSVSVLQREFMRQICTSGGLWLLDMSEGWFSHPILVDAFAKAEDIFRTAMKHDRGSIAQIAVFTGEYAYRSQEVLGVVACWRNWWPTLYLRGLAAMSGVPLDVYRLDDLPAVKSRYKVFVFPCAQGLTDEERRNIEALKRDGNVLVFGPAAGYIGERNMAMENIESLIGMTLQQKDDLRLTAKIVNADHPLTRELTGFIGVENYEHENFYTPLFYVTDPSAVALAKFVDGGGDKTAIAVKDQGTWQSVYFGTHGYWPPEFFRGLARMKRLHVYSTDGDVMFFARSLIALHASSDGVKTIRLPEEMAVTSLWDNQTLGTVKAIVRPMRTGDNALYLLTSPKDK